MDIHEIGVVVYLLLWLVAVIDAAIGKFARWYHQPAWLLVLFLVPFGSLAYLTFGCRQVVRGGIRALHRKKSRPQPRSEP